MKFAAFLTIALLTMGCTGSDPNPDPYTDSGNDTFVNPDSWAPMCEKEEQDQEVCGSCVTDQFKNDCSVEYEACDSDPDCDAFDHCFERHPENVEICEKDFPHGARLFRELFLCACDACNSNCCYFCQGRYGQLIE